MRAQSGVRAAACDGGAAAQGEAQSCRARPTEAEEATTDEQHRVDRRHLPLPPLRLPRYRRLSRRLEGAIDQAVREGGAEDEEAAAGFLEEAQGDEAGGGGERERHWRGHARIRHARILHTHIDVSKTNRKP